MPQLKGKEKRKAVASKEGFLGVEGLSKEVLSEVLLKYGVIGEEISSPKKKITKTDFYELGLSGTQNSAQNRQAVISALNLPKNLSSSALLDVVNSLYGYDEFVAIAEKALK